MKKILLMLTLCLSTVALQAQEHERAVGVRFGGSAELLYQHELSSENFLQFTLALPNYDGISVTGIYNWRCLKWDWTPQTCDWYLNAGFGAAAGAYNFDDTGLLLGVAGSCAFGCKFKDAPVSIEVDYRPVVGAVFGGGDKGFFTPGLWNFGVAVKYHF